MTFQQLLDFEKRILLGNEYEDGINKLEALLISQVKYDISKSDIPVDYMGAALSGIDVSPEIRELLTPKLDAIAANPESWYTFMGPMGTGKTYVAIAAAKVMYANYVAKQMQAGQLSSSKRGIKYVRAYDIFSKIRTTYKRDSELDEQDVLDMYREPTVLIIDELCRNKDSEAASDALFNIIDSRYSDHSNKMTIICTNKTYADINNSLDPAMVDRIAQISTILNFNWQSLRKPIVI